MSERNDKAAGETLVLVLALSRFVMGTKYAYVDVITGLCVLSDKFPHKEIEDGMLWEVEAKERVWRKKHTSACRRTDERNGCDCDVKDEEVWDIVAFYGLEEFRDFTKHNFLTFVKAYSVFLPDALADKKEFSKIKAFGKGFLSVVKYLVSKFDKLHFFTTPHYMGSLIFAYFKDGATLPTFLYFAHAMEWTYSSMPDPLPLPPMLPNRSYAPRPTCALPLNSASATISQNQDAVQLLQTPSCPLISDFAAMHLDQATSAQLPGTPSLPCPSGYPTNADFPHRC